MDQTRPRVKITHHIVNICDLYALRNFVRDNNRNCILIDDFFISKCLSWSTLYFAHVQDCIAYRLTFAEFEEDIKNLPFSNLIAYQ